MPKNKSNELRKCAGWNIRRAARQVCQIFDSHLSPVEIKNTQFSTLAIISGAGSMSVNELAKFMGTDRTTLTRNLSLLEKRGFIQITKNDEDSRTRDITITEKGSATFQAAYPLWQEAQQKIKSYFSEEEWNLLHYLIGKIDAETRDK